MIIDFYNLTEKKKNQNRRKKSAFQNKKPFYNFLLNTYLHPPEKTIQNQNVPEQQQCETRWTLFRTICQSCSFKRIPKRFCGEEPAGQFVYFTQNKKIIQIPHPTMDMDKLMQRKIEFHIT